jgi:tripartite-type tricarboxylate transporter receptor subunit TctC
MQRHRLLQRASRAVRPHTIAMAVLAGLAGFDVRLWFGLLAPTGTPRDAVDRLSAATRQALNAPELEATLAAQGYDPLIGTPEEFAAFYRGEVAKWAKVIAAVGTIGD